MVPPDKIDTGNYTDARKLLFIQFNDAMFFLAIGEK